MPKELHCMVYYILVFEDFQVFTSSKFGQWSNSENTKAFKIGFMISSGMLSQNMNK